MRDDVLRRLGDLQILLKGGNGFVARAADK